MTDRYSILITGSNGYCGSYLYKYFKNQSDKFQVFSTSRRKQSIANHIQHDLFNPIPINLFPKKIDCIIHCAGNLEHTSKFSVVKDNLKMGFNICQYAIKAKCQHFINFSSVMVYGKTGINLPISEDSPTFPFTVYGLSKLLGENLINGMLSNFLNVTNLRIGKVISQDIPQRYFLAKFKELLLKGETITLINPDKTRFNFIELYDIAKICELLIYTKNEGAFNIVCNDHPNLRQTIQEMKKYFNSSSIIKEILKERSEEFTYTFTNKKIKEVLNIDFKSYHDTFYDIFSK
jgi:nucleoside-diphosphate-sugar epimerase